MMIQVTKSTSTEFHYLDVLKDNLTIKDIFPKTKQNKIIIQNITGKFTYNDSRFGKPRKVSGSIILILLS